MTAGLAPGATVEGANTPVIGSALEHITLPALFDDTGKSSPPSRGLYRSVLTNTRVAKLLDPGTSWVTNMEGMGNGRAWTPVTRHGFDVVVAGTNSELFAILLALGDV